MVICALMDIYSFFLACCLYLLTGEAEIEQGTSKMIGKGKR